MSLSRREFLKSATVAASGLATAGLIGKQAGAETKKGPRYGMVIDLRRCMGCHPARSTCSMKVSPRISASRVFVSRCICADWDSHKI